MGRRFLALLMLACVGLASPVSGGQAPAMTDPQIGSRALTDADLEKYVAILARVTQANKERKGVMSEATLKEVNDKKAQACREQGWTTLDYAAVDARMMTAQLQLKLTGLPVPEGKVADVAIARKFLEKITAAQK
jgi:hypothetical protein